MKTTEIILSNYVELIRNYKDLNKNWIQNVNNLETLIGYRQKRADKLNSRLTVVTKKEIKINLKKELEKVNLELKMFSDILACLLTLIDFHFRGSGTSFLMQKIDKLESIISKHEKFAEFQHITILNLSKK